jgi:hypothetical protein
VNPEGISAKNVARENLPAGQIFLAFYFFWCSVAMFIFPSSFANAMNASTLKNYLQAKRSLPWPV